MTHMDQYIIPAGNAAEAAPGVERLDVKAVNRKQDRSLYAGREKVYPKLAHGRFRTVKWLVMAADARHLLRAALAALASRPRPARPGRAARHGAQPLLLFLPRDLAAGVLLRHRPAGAGGPGAVPRHVRRGARVVRLHLPADGVDRSHGAGRAVLAGRPQRPHAARQGALGAGQALQEGHDAPLLARHRRWRPAALSSSISATRRRWPPSCSPARRRPSPISSSASSRSRPTCSAASPASRSASTCAPGRASRAPWSTTRRCW